MELRRLEVRAALGLLLALALTLGHVDAALAEAEVHANAGPGTYVVQPGETLTELAERFGVSARALMRTNGIQHPRELYPGQTLTITGGVPAGTLRRTLAYGEDLLALTRAADLDWAPVARLGGVLLPTRLEAGHTVSLPADAMDAAAAGRTHWMPVAPSRAPRVVGAVRHNVSLWEMLTLNRLPVTAEQWLAVPMQDGAAPAETGLPYPVTSLRVSPQPMQRGETAAIAVETAAPVTCRLRYLDRTEVCYPTAEGGHAWHGLVGLPTMMATGPVTVTVELETEEGAWLFIPVPMVVSAGRYDYERLDLPADRQALLDPQLSAAERAKLAQLRTLRSPTRYWTYPFLRPLESAVTSYFGSRRSYGAGFGSFHAGTDFDGEVGMPVVAPAAGVVILAEPLIVQGNAILIDHGWGVVSGFWHLSQIGVSVGQEVHRGEWVGAVGNTGLSTGAHLHWELWVNGVQVNALQWLEPGGPGAWVDAVP